MNILDLISKHQSSGTRKFYRTVADDHIQDVSYDSASMVKDKHYFKIRLCEMFLKDKANWLQSFIPMAVALNVFHYATEKKEIPVFLGHAMLQEIERYIKDQDIEFSNVPIIGPIPYTGTDISIFLGLYRISGNDLAKSLFEVVGTIIGAFNLSNFATYLDMADRIGPGVAKLIGLPQVSMRFGQVDTFGSQGNVMRDRYLLYINCPEGSVKKENIWVKEGRLFQGATQDSGTPFTQHDYCLVRIEKLDSRTDIDTLPFHKTYLDSQAKIWENKPDEAKMLFLNLMRELSCSPDLTSEDRSALMKTYLANYQQERDNHAAVIGKLKTRGQSAAHRIAFRSGAATLSLIEKIQVDSLTEDLAISKPELAKVQKSLHQLTTTWNKIPHLGERETPSGLTARQFAEQFRAIKAAQKSRPVSPEVLSGVIAHSALKGGLATA